MTFGNICSGSRKALSLADHQQLSIPPAATWRTVEDCPLCSFHGGRLVSAAGQIGARLASASTRFPSNSPAATKLNAIGSRQRSRTQRRPIAHRRARASRYFHANSVTPRVHQCAVRAVDADLAVICDFDTGIRLSILGRVPARSHHQQQHCIFLARCSSNAGFTFKLPRGPVSAIKYQGKPNCMFIAFEPHQAQIRHRPTLRLCHQVRRSEVDTA